MPFANRPYQLNCRAAIKAALQRGVTKQLIVMSTGTGKTRVAADLPDALSIPRHQRLGFVVHRDELAYQAAEAFHQQNPHLSVGIEKAKHRAGDADIVVFSVQTTGGASYEGDSDGNVAWAFTKRLQGFNPDHFWGIMIDECHHASRGKNYHALCRYFRCMKGEPESDGNRVLMGFTATPNRSDNLGLEVLFDEITFDYGIRPAVNDGWLARIMAYRVQTEVDLSKVAVRGGDFQIGDLQNTVNTPVRNELIAREYRRVSPKGPSLFYTVDIQHSCDLAACLRKHGAKVYPISGRTPDAERAEMIDLMRQGKIDGLTSCGVLNEGTDIPRVAAGWMCRPTKSSLLFQQQVGRVLRLYPSPEDREDMRLRGVTPDWVKDEALIIDVVDVSSRHPLVTIATLFGLKQKFDGKGKDILRQVEEVEKVESEHPNANVRDIEDISHLRTVLQRADLLAPPQTPPAIAAFSDFKWLQQSEGHYHLGLGDGRIVSVHEDTLGRAKVWSSLKGVRTLLHDAATLREAIEVAERQIPGRDRAWMAAAASWREKAPKEEQVRLLWMLDRKLKSQFPTPAGMFQYATERFRSGDAAFSRGSISDRISAAKSKRA